ncbi:MAG: NAD(P)/FAD-dependent oxidoreductase [Bacteroidetes bacterium]|nr:NAD(P)/FAD-dependent oxidoreductase [Bacteroidota bacterium]
MKSFDVLVIGSGMAGNTIANRCGASGLKTAISDSRPYGGTCALRGCDPKKILIGATEIVDRKNKMVGKGLQGSISINWADLMQYKNEFTSNVPANLEKGYSRNGVVMYHGEATFTNNNSVRVGDEIIDASKIVIATGARPATLNFSGGDHAIDSTAFLDLEMLPKEIVFIGGGYIAMEFSHLAARAGSYVTILHRGSIPLERFETFTVEHLVTATKKLGVTIEVNSEVMEITQTGNRFVVTVENSKENTEYRVECDLVVNSTGRVPDLESLDLESAGVIYSSKGVEVNEFLQSTSNPKVYVAGDSAASGGSPLTPVAVMEGHIVSSNIIKGNSKIPDYREMPSAVFTLPTLASVGYTEVQAQEKGLDFKVKSAAVPNWYNARRINEDTYAYKTLVGANGEVLGAHLIGPHAEEMINMFAIAIKSNLKAVDLKSLVYAYPSMTSDIASMV